MKNKTILITGCSTGIGHDAALTLAKRGHRIIAACRKQADVDRLISFGLESVQMDVASPSSIAKAFAEVLDKTEGQLDVLINNAGYTQAGALEDIHFDVLYEQFATNVFGLMELTRLAIPIMRQQQQGRIINISSIFGIVSMPFHGAYIASKHAIEGLSDTLRLELKSSGIKVISIQPGPVTSNLKETILDYSLKKLDVVNSHFHHQYWRMLGPFREKRRKTIFTRGAHVVTNKLIHAIEVSSPKTKYPVTWVAYFCIFLKRILTVTMLDRIMSCFFEKVQQTMYRS